jgi:COMPASS component SWD2
LPGKNKNTQKNKHQYSFLPHFSLFFSAFHFFNFCFISIGCKITLTFRFLFFFFFFSLLSFFPKGVMHRKGRSVVAFDPQGLIFGVAAESNLVKLFDVRSYDKGPFSTFHVSGAPIEWSSIKFSPDGNHVLASTRSSIIFLLDAYSGQVKQSFTVPNPGQSSLDASFSPDGNYVICGAPEGGIHIWETTSGTPVTVLKAHPSAVTTAKFNPRTAMIASACSQLAFWIPQVLE